MREWVKEKNVSNTRVAVKDYGKKNSKEKLMNEWERKMEIHKELLIREMILIAATGIKYPKKMLSLKWEDISVRKETISGLYGADKDSEELIAVIQINEERRKLVLELLLVKQENTLFV